MSLHTLANHMAAQGRNNDSMLVHMTPREVNGLHALALAHGGNLTINPETGLPEAGFLEDLLPAVIGFGLDTFVPGLGEAVGGALGLSGAAGTGIAVGGLTGLATGSLSKGVMAGFGAYGGAGLADSLINNGINAATNAGTAGYESILAERGLIPGTPEYGAAASELALNAKNSALAASRAASPMDRLTAGFSATTQNPEGLMGYAKDNWKNLVAAGAPALMGLSTQDQTVTKMPDDRMITPFVMNQRYVPRNESLSPSAQQRHITYGVTPITPVHAANGGAVSTFDDGGSVGRDAYGREVGDPDFGKLSDRYEGITVQGGFDRYGNLNGTDAARRAMLNNTPPSAGADNRQNGDTDDYTRLLLNAAAPRRTYQNTMTGDSAKAFDYLMGNTPATTTTESSKVAQVRAPGVALTTAAPAALTPQTVEPHGGGSSMSLEEREAKNDPKAWANLTDAQKADYFANPNSTIFGIPALDIQEKFQNYWASSPFGMVQNYFAPGEQGRAANITNAARMQMALQNSANTGANLDNGLATVRQNPFDTQKAFISADSNADALDAGMREDSRSLAERQSDANNSRGGGDGPNGPDGRGEPGGDRDGWGRGGGYAHGGIAALAGGGLGSLGGYSDGGRLLRGPGDGVSDSIPATIGQHQPARLADGEFVVPARIVSELGNGSTEAGARQLYAMMDRIQAGRKKTMGKNKVAANSRAAKHLPA